MKKTPKKHDFSRYCNNERNIIILVAIIVGLISIPTIKGAIKHFTNTPDENPFLYGMEVEDFDKYIETQKDVPSDIKGMSVYDKYAMGLQRQDGSDSDFDGLTDKEEIEAYGSDPLKASTAGDLYSDSYKVANGMDLFTYYDYAEEMTFAYNECQEVKLTASDPTDFSAVVKDKTSTISPEDFSIEKLYKAYQLYNYSGTVLIDLSDTYSDNGITEKDIEIYVSEGPFVVKGLTELNKVAISSDGNKVTLDKDFSDSEKYFIFIAKKQDKLVGSIYNKIFGKFEKSNETAKSENGTAVIYGYPIIGSFKVIYVECSTEENTSNFMSSILNYMNQNSKDGKMQYSADILSSVSKTEMSAKLSIFRTLFPNSEGDLYEGGTKKYKHISDFFDEYKDRIFFAYMVYEVDTSDIARYDEEKESTEPVSSGFDKWVDELPFQNFESYIAEGGNCAGITHLSSYLYNTKSIPTSGSYDCTINGTTQTVNWDLTSDNDNSTLYDTGLIDYKKKSFIDDHSSKDNNYLIGLSEGEEEFVNMVGCFWAEGNDRVNMTKYELQSGEYDSVELVKNMMNLIDQGKILDMYLYMRYGGAHAVNVYGYEYVDDETINFYVYDSNLPQDDRKGYNIDNIKGQCTLQVFLSMNEDGTGSFEFLYWPMTDNTEYLASSAEGLMNSHAIVVMDENWNILN